MGTGSIRVATVRDGSAILSTEPRQQPINFGDAVLVRSNALCGSGPEGQTPAVAWPTKHCSPSYSSIPTNASAPNTTGPSDCR